MTFCFFLSSFMSLLEVTSIKEKRDSRWLCFLRRSGYGTLYALWVWVIASFCLAEILLTLLSLKHPRCQKLSSAKTVTINHTFYSFPAYTLLIPQSPLKNFMDMETSTLFLVIWSLTLASSFFFPLTFCRKKKIHITCIKIVFWNVIFLSFR